MSWLRTLRIPWKAKLAIGFGLLALSFCSGLCHLATDPALTPRPAPTAEPTRGPFVVTEPFVIPEPKPRPAPLPYRWAITLTIRYGDDRTAPHIETGDVCSAFVVVGEDVVEPDGAAYRLFGRMYLFGCRWLAVPFLPNAPPRPGLAEGRVISYEYRKVWE